ncbi:MAG: 4-hydroxy-tetrahydrodipicolinate reductase [Oscillospiraceae bacterium]|nr:4-hydroxy-tetrahydrodipicolinate reductase [Oscillospiraceae bacterium]
MFNIILSGANGRMGKTVAELVRARSDMKISFGIDSFDEQAPDFPVFSSFYKRELISEGLSCIIDFSHPSGLSNLLLFAKEKFLPLVLSTTGYNSGEKEEIRRASESVAIFQSGNMSLGVNLMIELAKKAAAVLGENFDIEIIEKHHSQKIDAPSGTAYMLAEGINSVLGDKYSYRFDRQAVRGKRPADEIGIHSVRGGTIVGEHELIFAGNDEIITISHSAYSRRVFAEGALRAAQFIALQKPGLYNMSDMIGL